MPLPPAKPPRDNRKNSTTNTVRLTSNTHVSNVDITSDSTYDQTDGRLPLVVGAHPPAGSPYARPRDPPSRCWGLGMPHPGAPGVKAPLSPSRGLAAAFQECSGKSCAQQELRLHTPVGGSFLGTFLGTLRGAGGGIRTLGGAPCAPCAPRAPPSEASPEDYRPRGTRWLPPLSASAPESSPLATPSPSQSLHCQSSPCLLGLLLTHQPPWRPAWGQPGGRRWLPGQQRTCPPGPPTTGRPGAYPQDPVCMKLSVGSSTIAPPTTVKGSSTLSPTPTLRPAPVSPSCPLVHRPCTKETAGPTSPPCQPVPAQRWPCPRLAGRRRERKRHGEAPVSPCWRGSAGTAPLPAVPGPPPAGSLLLPVVRPLAASQPPVTPPAPPPRRHSPCPLAALPPVHPPRERPCPGYTAHAAGRQPHHP